MELKILTLEDVKTDASVIAMIEQADRSMNALGYTEHGFRHADLVAHISHNIIDKLGFPGRDAELAAVAGYLHDIGNAVSREFHGVTGALLARSTLEKMGFPLNEIVSIMSAIGNHEEEYGHPTSEIAAATILADKSDVHRSRVRNPDMAAFDIHDRVNYAAEKSYLKVEAEEGSISLEIVINTKISTVMEYFEIFLSRMIICKKAAEFLDSKFNLIINNTILT